MNKRERMKQRIVENGYRIAAWAGIAKGECGEIISDRQADKLSRAIHRIEIQAHAAATAHCNGDIGDDLWCKACDVAYRRLEKVIGKHAASKVEINGDPRGYALKTTYHADLLHRDLGGYGILAPEIDGSE